MSLSVLESIIYPVVEEVKAGLTNPEKFKAIPETKLIGDGAVIDSLGLVSLLVAVEEKAEKVTGKSIRLLSERAMSRKNSPFLTLSSLAAWVEELIKGDESLES